VNQIATTTIGRLTRKIQRQPRCSARSPPASGPAAVAAAVGDVEDGHRGGEHRGAADPLRDPGGHQGVHRRREGAQERGHPEDHQTGEVRGTAPVTVGERAGAEEESGERQGVAVEDPGQVLRAGFQVAGDAGQRDDHDGDVDE
jgi:hypothetical protein